MKPDDKDLMREHWEEIAGVYISQRAFSPADRRIIELIGELRPKKMLEIGIGACAIARAVLSGYQDIRYFGLDLTRGFLDYAKKSLPNPMLIRATALSLPVKSDTLNLTLEMDTIHHVPQELLSGIIGEIYRVTKPQGLFMLMEDWGKEPENPRERLMRQMIHRRKMNRAGLEYHPSDEEWRQLLENAGFSIIHREYLSRKLSFQYLEKTEDAEIQAALIDLKGLWGDEAPVTEMTLMIGRK